MNHLSDELLTVFRKRTLFNKNIRGIGFGLKETLGKCLLNTLAIRVYVRKKEPNRFLSNKYRIPSNFQGIATDIIPVEPTSKCWLGWRSKISSGTGIINDMGVPGTLGYFVKDHQRESVFISNYHVLFGKGALPGQKIWSVKNKQLKPIGYATTGKLGNVKFQGSMYFIDVGFGRLNKEMKKSTLFRASKCRVTGFGSTLPGAFVKKIGSASYETEGIIVDVKYPTYTNIGGQYLLAPNQVLIKPKSADSFSDEGDSGAMIIDQHENIIGVLWGRNKNGEGVACPIGPIINEFKIVLK